MPFSLRQFFYTERHIYRRSFCIQYTVDTLFHIAEGKVFQEGGEDVKRPLAYRKESLPEGYAKCRRISGTVNTAPALLWNPQKGHEDRNIEQFLVPGLHITPEAFRFFLRPLQFTWHDIRRVVSPCSFFLGTDDIFIDVRDLVPYHERCLICGDRTEIYACDHVAREVERSVRIFVFIMVGRLSRKNDLP